MNTSVVNDNLHCCGSVILGLFIFDIKCLMHMSERGQWKKMFYHQSFQAHSSRDHIESQSLFKSRANCFVILCFNKFSWMKRGLRLKRFYKEASSYYSNLRKTAGEKKFVCSSSFCRQGTAATRSVKAIALNCEGTLRHYLLLPPPQCCPGTNGHVHQKSLSICYTYPWPDFVVM